MLAGTVRAVWSGPPSAFPSLSIVGNGASNAIDIQEVASADGVVEVHIHGIDTRIVSISEVEATRTVRRGTDFTFWARDIYIAMGPGDDYVSMHDTVVPGRLLIDMGTGSNKLRLTNVQALGMQSGPVSNWAPWGAEGSSVLIALHGRGNSVSLNDVSAAGNVTIDADRGRDNVALNRVVAGTAGSGNTLAVRLGLTSLRGRHNFGHVDVASSAADNAVFTDNNGVSVSLSLNDNQFAAESDSGFVVAK
jgi:hypothetical protein